MISKIEMLEQCSSALSNVIDTMVTSFARYAIDDNTVIKYPKPALPNDTNTIVYMGETVYKSHNSKLYLELETLTLYTEVDGYDVYAYTVGTLPIVDANIIMSINMLLSY